MASTYPNEPVSFATEGRVSPDDPWYEPRATATIDIPDASQPLGVFGHYETLILNFTTPLKGLKKV